MSKFFIPKKCPVVAPAPADHCDAQQVAQSTAETPQLIETGAVATVDKRKKRKTPQDNDKRKRSVAQTTRYTPEEDAYINKRVAASGLCRADFILTAICGHITVQVTGVPELMREFHHIGHNLNQALKIANKEKSTNVMPLKEAIKGVNESRVLMSEFCGHWDANIGKIKKGG